jgi:hypothetical protein
MLHAKFFRSFILLVAYCLQQFAYAELPFNHPELQNYDRTNFIYPNETHPGQAALIYDTLAIRTDDASLISVGTERSFAGFARMGAKGHLLAIDINARVVQYNLLNIGLLALSESLDHYLKLRLATTHGAWLQALQNQNGIFLSDQARQALLDPTMFDMWSYHHRETSSMVNLNEFVRRTADLPHDPFYGFHYPSDPRLWSKLSVAAKQGRMHVGHLDLGKNGHIEVLKSFINARQIKIGLIDVSNVPSWWVSSRQEGTNNVDEHHINEILTKLKAHLLPLSFLLITQSGSDGSEAWGTWGYRAFSTAFWFESQTAERVRLLRKENNAQYRYINGNVVNNFTSRLHITAPERGALCHGILDKK